MRLLYLAFIGVLLSISFFKFDSGFEYAMGELYFT